MRYFLPAIVALSLMPSTASAVVLPPTDRPQTTTRVMESLRIAREFWRADVPVRVYAASGASLRSATGTVGASAAALGSTIWLDAAMLAEDTYWSRIASCTLLVHEYGHALGIAHSTSRESVMFGSIALNRVVYGCYQRFMARGQAKRWRELRGTPHWLTR